ncbi:hypothetical protein SCATT_p03740 (plasmid) [Streptantibioticus cattleyicolor NRRL 8057 = DSM 46488]|uniref:Uncharacterized protein n=1 Tax=Streptantibioticus cattleyicolor (strain ATCC 35852 / DSM 46488 / JCM 4925 / NBRC 14057 / NRRL 8057) TaxID=1003195 RepID=G8XFJ8_STREN|nr:hypothetical protein SCATT_p03740 [Streptantibioticus cattleyicolor NRRL 8057 = DSM 46488]
MGGGLLRKTPRSLLPRIRGTGNNGTAGGCGGGRWQGRQTELA